MTVKNVIVRFIALAVFLLMPVALFVACDSSSDVIETVSSFGTDTVVEAELTTTKTEEAVSEEYSTEEHTIGANTTDENTTEEATTEEVTTEVPYPFSYEIYKSDLADIMQNMFEGEAVIGESVMFIDHGEKKSLMYYADSITSVTSYDGLVTYIEGVDYALEDGKIVLLEGSSIPCITSDVYYNNTESDSLTIEHNGEICNVYWGDGRQMTQWQILVSYTHFDSWDGFKQENFADVYEEFISKLCRGEDVTVLFYGDSIARGATSSAYVRHDPYQPNYTKLFVYALADLFNYKVVHTRTALPKTFNEYFPTYNDGEDVRGTIYYVNSSVGGWGCYAAHENVDQYVCEVIEKYGCDLLVVNFGMNDGTVQPKTFQTYIKQMLNIILESAPDISVMMVSPMVSNPYDTDSGKNQILFEDPLESTAERYNRAGTPCALVRVGSVSESMLEHKTFNDYSGNNINHPNDFFMRVYAQTLVQALIGYENMK